MDALVRICAEGDQRWSFLPRQLCGICPENGKITSEDAVSRDSVSDDGVDMAL